MSHIHAEKCKNQTPVLFLKTKSGILYLYLHGSWSGGAQSYCESSYMQVCAEVLAKF